MELFGIHVPWHSLGVDGFEKAFPFSKSTSTERPLRGDVAGARERDALVLISISNLLNQRQFLC
jgi:hypothetical protein